MSLIPPRDVNRDEPFVTAEDRAALERLAFGQQFPIDWSGSFNDSGAEVIIPRGTSGIGHALALSDTIGGARERAVSRLARTILQIIDTPLERAS